jgi:hypothetical protein
LLFFLVFSLLTLLSCGSCGGYKPSDKPSDPRAGETAVIYYAKHDFFHHNNAKIMATALAEYINTSRFYNIADDENLDALDYDTFFVFVQVDKDGPAKQIVDFLSQQSFVNGAVYIFWTGNVAVADKDRISDNLRSMARSAGILRVFGFPEQESIKKDEAWSLLSPWLNSALDDLAERRNVGNRAEDTMKALAAGYPDRIKDVEWNKILKDWTFMMDGHVWRYAGGRILRDTRKPENFRRLSIYRYTPEKPLPVSTVGVNQWYETAIKEQPTLRQIEKPPSAWTPPNFDLSASDFYQELWHCRTRAEAESHLVWVGFLGWKIRIHEGIKEPLMRVQERIRLLEKANDQSVLDWENSLNSAGAWNWRNIAETGVISFHSYGVAIDLVMRNTTQKETYWQWTRDKGKDWQALSYALHENNRISSRASSRAAFLLPPESVVRAFEQEGFTWGGKWFEYDTMHFEYRPEILIMGFRREIQRGEAFTTNW